MNRTGANRRRQCRALAQQVNSSDTGGFLQILTGAELHETLQSQLPEHRQRLYPPTETLSMFLAQAMADDRSCQRVVNERAIERLGAGLAPGSVHTSAYCQARQRLPEKLIAELARHSGRLLHGRAPDRWRWRRRRVIIVDATTLSMPDTDANQKRFPQHRGQPPGLGFPITRLLGLLCLSSGALLDAACSPIRGKGSDEHTLLRPLLDTLEAGDVLLGDANFPSYWLLAALRERGVDGVFEQIGGRRAGVDFRRGERLGTGDHIIELRRPQRPHWMNVEAWARVPRTLRIRELRVGRAQRSKVLVTTMLSVRQGSKKALGRLYRQRWRVELDLRDIKATLGMDVLSCRTPEMVVKEIWVYLLAYNLLRIVMAQAASVVGTSPRKLSFKHALQLWRAWWPRRRAGHLDETQVMALLELIGSRRVGNRPGRREPRAVKRRPKCFKRLWAPRPIARQQIRYR